MQFTFFHAADLHIDSPLAGLNCKDAAVAARFARAGRRAVEALIDETIAAKAAFLLICGDIFDGDWKAAFVAMLSSISAETARRPARAKRAATAASLQPRPASGLSMWRSAA